MSCSPFGRSISGILSRSREASLNKSTLRIAGDAKMATLEFTAARSAEPTTIGRVVELRPKTKIKGQTLELPTLRIAIKVVKP